MSDFSDYMDFFNFVQYARRFRAVGPRRYLRDFSDPFTKYSNTEFYVRYRFTPEAVKNTILPLVAPALQRKTRRGLPFAPEIKLLITLRYFATGSFQKMDGDVMNICQQSMSRIIAEISNLLASKMRDFVKFPATEALSTVKQKFYEVAHFPGVIGCIDCTHIKIRNPRGETTEIYRNGKGWFSINVQAVIGPNMEFYDVVAQWPGSSHNSFIYNSSTVKQKLISGALNGIILGDSGYAVSNVLLTPFLSPTSPGQEAYNRSHIKTRNSVERCFGIFKRKFPCLQVGMGIHASTVVAVICACAALHNIAILQDDSGPSNNEYIHHDIKEIFSEEYQNIPGFSMQQSIVERFFS